MMDTTEDIASVMIEEECDSSTSSSSSSSSSSTAHSYIINTKALINNKTKMVHNPSKGKKERVADYEIRGDKAIWDSDAFMILRSKLVIHGSLENTYEEYEKMLYEKLKNSNT